ncbi:hypothetical protein HPB50_003521 [Hyalomma asiaticum]|uniref:Uncharacterized protein n=1 Tax=Hyalomma asiaticum TaxID=266040 RepID=A0ACB7RT06_HYAAI|nr:hypothetical protein HPB50_003521 [Hyalomma asiaticum]
MLASTKHRRSQSPIRLPLPPKRRVCFADAEIEGSIEETSDTSKQNLLRDDYENLRLTSPALRRTSTTAEYWDHYNSPQHYGLDLVSMDSSTTWLYEKQPSTPTGLFPDVPTVPPCPFLREPGAHSVRPPLGVDWPNAFEQGSSEGTFQPVTPSDDRRTSMLSWLPSIGVGMLVAAMLTVALTLTLTMDLQDSDVEHWPTPPLSGVKENVGSRRASIPLGPIRNPQGRRPEATIRLISEAYNVTRRTRTAERARPSDRLLDVPRPRLPRLPASNRTLSHRCGRHFYTYCNVGRSDVYYSASLRACTSTETDSAHVCNHGANRFTSLESCHTSCVHVTNGRPQDRCYESALFSTCSWQDAAETWWYNDGAVCAQWTFPLGNCPLQEERLFRTRVECEETCLLRREGEYSSKRSRCDAPDAATCTPQQVKYPYFAIMRANRAARCISASSPELKTHRCLVGSNRFESVASCERACVDT